MKKTIILVCVLAIALVGTLYSLPKIVVNSKSQDVEGGQQTEQASGGESTGASGSNSESEHFNQSLTPEQKQVIDPLRASFVQATADAKMQAAIKLSETFGQFQKFDSAAYYAEQAAILDPSLENQIRTADRYYEAYGFAVDEEKAKTLGEKTRTYYKKALDQNPELLSAKANMAMTYVNTASPMQGIMLLREVLDADPTNELALFNLGILSMRSNQYTKAVERFRQILLNHPSNTKAQFYLGVCLVELGRDEEASEVLADVKKKEKDPVIQQAIGELEQRLKK
ncbi:tetratricopeptide repeat protein [Arundinibacter roseus]|uniref:Tetratricopeptide repeat protein n=1 Tax=Arundinibacter roseus TaxID=2070510 RepID=A0A4R4K9D4_9BACT|nr:tetratricopeptide repeat protein [Arundinibacter roseus]TDB64103.1 tetratricopeptide repeat protein [Arundinibacter roseus]